MQRILVGRLLDKTRDDESDLPPIFGQRVNGILIHDSAMRMLGACQREGATHMALEISAMWWPDCHHMVITLPSKGCPQIRQVQDWRTLSCELRKDS